MENKDFENLYKRNYKRSFLFAKSYVHDDLAAEDIVAESLVKYWRVTSQENTEASDALLLTILKHKSLDYLRHQAIHLTAIGNIADINIREMNTRISTLEACNPSDIFSKEIRQIINKTLHSLPKQTRQIFYLSRFENKSVKEIAEITNITVKGVEYHITKSLKVLRIALKDYLPFLLFFIN
ncbi:RNA polymerase sigma-70 factor [Parabacteroides bouchesdurhonensis]|uniref:RNA polymerase sigma-70 factor n=1 Tax=Parabacteroides bouchesdurhonensis TaxID=1936995 RepID=UPI000E52A433|nr:RNA polymerase sigma-70 factor [Parabacteroides bouchesdurhonensis]RHJ94096.1 RNA polymerase sigma-70 factor [Bacteroides sp. AM07-16]